MDKDKKYKINGYKRFIVIKKSEEEIILKLIENDKLYIYYLQTKTLISM